VFKKEKKHLSRVGIDYLSVYSCARISILHITSVCCMNLFEWERQYNLDMKE